MTSTMYIKISLLRSSAVSGAALIQAWNVPVHS